MSHVCTGFFFLIIELQRYFLEAGFVFLKKYYMGVRIPFKKTRGVFLYAWATGFTLINDRGEGGLTNSQVPVSVAQILE